MEEILQIQTGKVGEFLSVGDQLVEMRIAAILADGKWKTVDEIKSIFILYGWSFLNTSQLARLCHKIQEIQRRNLGHNSHIQYRL